MTNFSNSFLKISLVLVVVTIPFKPVWGSYSIIALGIAGILNLINSRKVEVLPFFSYLLVIAFLVRVAWLASADDFLYGLGRLETEFPLFIIPLIFSMFIVSNQIKALFIRAYVVTMICIMLYAFFRLGVYIKDAPYSFLDYTLFHLDPVWFWKHSRYFAQNMLTWDYAHYTFTTIMVLYGLQLLTCLEEKRFGDKILMIVFLLLTILFLLYTGSRIGLLAFVGLLFVYFISSLKFFFERRITVIGTLIGLSVLAVSILIKYGESIDPVRYQYASWALDAIADKPILGHGTGSAKAIMHHPEFEKEVGYSVNHPHNQFLSELLQFGILGSLPLLSFLGLSIWYAFVHRNREILLILFTAFLLMITEAPINSNKGLVPLLVILFLVINNASSNERK
jgi:O-antigen ligase